MQLALFLELFLTSNYHLLYSGCMEASSHRGAKIKATKRPATARAPVVLRDESLPTFITNNKEVVRESRQALHAFERSLENDALPLLNTKSSLRASVISLFEAAVRDFAGRTAEQLGDEFHGQLMGIADRWGLRIQCGCDRPARLILWKRTPAPSGWSWRLRHADGAKEDACITSKILPKLMFMAKSTDGKF